MTQADTELKTIAGYFDDQTQAERALHELRDAGFASAHLGVAHHDGTATTSSATDGSGSSSNSPGMWDKVKSFFEGGAAEPHADEYAKGDIASREITSDPSGTRGYESGDVHESLTNLSVPAERSRYLEHRLSGSENGAVVTVKAGARDAEAEAILRKNGADLGEEAEGYQYPESTGTKTEGLQKIQLLGEVLRVHTERVSRGEVHVRKEVITETQTVQVPVTREELVIERHNVSGNTPASGVVGEDSEIRIPLSEERASVEKGTVVREEVSVGKKAVNEVRDLSGDVRHEDLVVEDETETAPR